MLVQVVAEVVAAEDVTEVDRLAEYQARPVRPPTGPGPAAGPGAAPAPPATVMASRDSSNTLAAAARVRLRRQHPDCIVMCCTYCTVLKRAVADVVCACR